MRKKLNSIVKYMGIGIEFEVYFDDETYEIDIIPAQVKIMKTEMRETKKAPEYVVVGEAPKKDNATLIKELTEDK